AQPDPHSASSYAAHHTLSQRLAELQRLGHIPPLADPEASALLLLGAAMHTSLSELAQGDRAVAAGERELARRLGESLGLLAKR
ncbi:hypothetical protein, partial [Pseudomonas sp. 2FE]|uniref:hypothetical protein n=1 Tax=Pseudomonas sp. 2FE TaxID=2502190 RepID=UPI001C49864B